MSEKKNVKKRGEGGKGKKKGSAVRKIINVSIGLLALIPLAIFSLVVACNVAIDNVVSDRLYDNVDDIPKRSVCVVLGTTPYLKGNKNGNPYFNNRIAAAVQLYKARKVDTVILSGDSSKFYDETKVMHKALVKQGVPSRAIKLDTKGKSTFESIRQMKNRFNLKEFIVVSQRFQNERALFIANHYGMDAIGYNARDIDVKKGYRVYFREKLARVKVFIDLFRNML